MAGIQVDVSTGALTDAIARLRGGADQFLAIAGRVLTVFGAEGERLAKEAAPYKTGRMRGSIAFRVDAGDHDVSLTLGILKSTLSAAQAIGQAVSNRAQGVLVYAAMQEYGGTVHAKPGGLLAIPIGEALTGAGVPRFSPLEAKGLYLATFWRSFSAGGSSGPILWGVKARGKWGSKGFGNIVPLFVGVQSVTIQGSHFIGGAVDAILPKIAAALREQTLAQFQGEG